MTRVDRVMDLLDLLQGRDAAVTVAAIAEALAVSRRTVLRDLATLRERGWTIRADAGPGGGVVLDRGRGVTAVHLAVDEVAALWIAGQVSASFAAMPWRHALRSGLSKVLASLPRERGRSLHQLMRRIVVAGRRPRVCGPPSGRRRRTCWRPARKPSPAAGAWPSTMSTGRGAVRGGWPSRRA
jgi:predicted DNA-binding transcriptional regulator YafY